MLFFLIQFHLSQLHDTVYILQNKAFPSYFPFFPLEVHSDRQVSHIFIDLIDHLRCASLHQWKSQLVCLKRSRVRAKCRRLSVSPIPYSASVNSISRSLPLSHFHHLTAHVPLLFLRNINFKGPLFWSTGDVQRRDF